MKILQVGLLVLAPIIATPALLAQHGAPPAGQMMHGGGAPDPAPPVLAPVTYAAGVQEDKQVTAFMSGFAQALFTRDGKPMVPRLAASYVIEGWPADKNMHDAFVQALTMIPMPAKIHVTAIEPEGDGKVVKTELTFATRVTKRVFHFDAAGKLVNTDFISMKRPAATKPVAPATAPQPEHK